MTGRVLAFLVFADVTVAAGLSPDVGYQCPDGSQWYVAYCRDQADDANCAVVRLDLPPRNGFQVRTNEVRGDLIKLLQACSVREAVFDQGNVKLAGPITASRAPAKALSQEAEKKVGGAKGVENADWGKVEYIGNSKWIRRIGNMEVEYIGNSEWIRRIGNMEVEYIGNSQWIRRIGNLEVEYIGNSEWIRRIGNMNVEYAGEWISYIGNR